MPLIMLNRHRYRVGCYRTNFRYAGGRADRRSISTSEAASYLRHAEAKACVRARFAVRTVQRRRGALQVATAAATWDVWRERGRLYAEW